MSVELTRLPGVKIGTLPYYASVGWTMPTNDPANNYVPLWNAGRIIWAPITTPIQAIMDTNGDLLVRDQNGAIVALHERGSPAQGDILTPVNTGGGVFIPQWLAQSSIDVSGFGGGAALTKTDDTNVTATLTGTPTTALRVAAGFTLGWTGTLSDVRGGIDTGAWTPVAFAAGNFTAQAGNWTLASGDQLQFRYRLFGKTMHVGFVLVTTTVSATPTYLQITIPASKTAAATFGQPISAVDNGTARNAAAVISSTNIRLYIDAIAAIGGAGTWATATDNTAVFGTLTFETT